MVDLLKSLVEPLVVHSDEINITKIERDDLIVLELRVHPDDMGKVIGRRGRRAQAIRSIMKAKAKLTDERVIVDIVDPEE